MLLSQSIAVVMDIHLGCSGKYITGIVAVIVASS